MVANGLCQDIKDYKISLLKVFKKFEKLMESKRM